MNSTFNYKGTPNALHSNTGLPIEECNKIFEAYFKAFPGIKDYFKKQEDSMWENGYIQICTFSKMKSYIPNWKEYKWLDDNKNSIDNIWGLYAEGKKDITELGKGKLIPEPICLTAIKALMGGASLMDASIKAEASMSHLVYSMFKWMFKKKASYSNKSANMPSQGSSAHMTKTAMINYYKSIIERGLVHKCLIINAVHDEILIEVPDEIAEQEAKILQECMEKASSYFCRSVKIKAVPEIGKYWLH